MDASWQLWPEPRSRQAQRLERLALQRKELATLKAERTAAKARRVAFKQQMRDLKSAPARPFEPARTPVQPLPKPRPAVHKVVSGWYPDPSGRHAERLWDGVQWLELEQCGRGERGLG